MMSIPSVCSPDYRAEAEYGAFTPYVSVAYAHEFEDDQLNTTATLPGGATFGLNGSGLESAILISLGTDYRFTSDLSMNVGYHGEISVGGDGTDSHGGIPRSELRVLSRFCCCW